MSKSPKRTLPTAAAIVADLVENTYLLSDDNCPFSFHPQDGDPRVVVLAGENATGKSLLTSMLASRAYHDHGVEPMIVSMVARTSAGMQRAFTYGGEDYRATGEVSLSVSMKALNHLPTRLEEQGAGLVILDEPDVGLSENYAHAFGVKLGQAINALPDKGAWSVVLVSHSRELVGGLADTLTQAPTFVHTNEPKTLEAWASERPRKSVEELDALLNRAKEQVRQVRVILDASKEQAKKATRLARKPKG